ncbi:hypothetical protein [Delftia sp. JD2]|uniref:hypothetical protein n=1 Tax=Delftia sp. JD2 TaxID=469553 RepID=UPI00158695BF|nr:hypothetical protein [Delftia sp. JD2]
MKTEKEIDEMNLLKHYYKELKKILKDDSLSHEQFEEQYHSIQKEIEKLEN